MMKARAIGGYVASTVLLLLGALLAWQCYVLVAQPLGPGSMVIAWGIATKLWVVDLVVAMLGVACFAGAVAVIVRRPRRAATAVTP